MITEDLLKRAADLRADIEAGGMGRVPEHTDYLLLTMAQLIEALAHGQADTSYRFKTIQDSHRASFAERAMQGLIADGSVDWGQDQSTVARNLSACAVQFADAMLAELAREPRAVRDDGNGLFTAMFAFVRRVAYEPIGHAEATHKEILTMVVREALELCQRFGIERVRA